MRQHFYHGTTRAYIATFGMLFSAIKCTTGRGRLTPVPIHYAPKSKFLEMLDSGYDKDVMDIDMVLPRMAFEMTSINYAPERHLNPMHQLSSANSSQKTYNRLPYDFSFTLYVATKEFDDGLEIAEQIIPMFAPDFNVSIVEKVGELRIPTNLSVVMNSSSFSIDYEGSYTDNRRIEWSMNFTLKGYVYPNVEEAVRIKESIVDMFARSLTEDAFAGGERAWVDPRVALPSQPHEVKVENT